LSETHLEETEKYSFCLRSKVERIVIASNLAKSHRLRRD